MKTEDIATRSPSPWQPETAPRTLALFGKGIEECSELSAILARCIIQGMGECEPVTGRMNILALADELDDAQALIELIREMAEIKMTARVKKKKAFLNAWLITLSPR